MRRTGMVAVPLASALVGALATASVAWAATHPTTPPPATRAVTTSSHEVKPHYALVRGDDGSRWVLVDGTGTSTSVTTNPPATHTTSGASGAVR